MREGRLEHKFVAPLASLEGFARRASAFLAPDPHDPGDGYTVTTLYYDRYDLAGYVAKLDGQPHRRRVRLRRYGAEPRCWVEIRERRGRLVVKRRDPADFAPLAAWWAGRGAAPPRPYPPGVELADAIVRFGLQRPAVVTHYRRRAWIGRCERELRVTLDSGVAISAPPERDELRLGRPRPLLPAGWGILEVKGPELPSWAASAAIASRISAGRYSKFSAGIAALHP